MIYKLEVIISIDEEDPISEEGWISIIHDSLDTCACSVENVKLLKYSEDEDDLL